MQQSANPLAKRSIPLFHVRSRLAVFISYIHFTCLRRKAKMQRNNQKTPHFVVKYGVLAPTRGFEPPTYRLGGGRSILLSYVGLCKCYCKREGEKSQGLFSPSDYSGILRLPVIWRFSPSGYLDVLPFRLSGGFPFCYPGLRLPPSGENHISQSMLGSQEAGASRSMSFSRVGATLARPNFSPLKVCAWPGS